VGADREQWWLIGREQLWLIGREQWWLMGRELWWLIGREEWYLIGREQWWLIGLGAVVAHWLGSSGGSLVATPDCETAALGSNPAISPAYSGLPVFRRAAISDSTLL
jgi:hypothetical protein